MSTAEVKQRYVAAGQGHVFQYWDELSADEQSKLVEQASQMPIEQMGSVFEVSMRDFEAANAATSDSHDVTPLAPELMSTNDDPNDCAAWRSEGLRLIAAGKVGAMVLAGGQGTRLGSPLPKGMLNLSLPSGKEIFKLMADRILRLQQLAKEAHATEGKMQWYVMTSDATHAVIEEFFKKEGFLGLSPDQVTFFKQGCLPALTLEGKIIMQTKGSINVAPDGNGGIYRALKVHGVLDHMVQNGIEYIQAFNVDNILVKVADPTFFGFCSMKKVDVGAKSIAKTGPGEKVGVFAVKDGRKGVIEYSEIGEARAQATGDDGKLVYNEGNMSVYVYSVAFLQDLVANHLDSLPYHVAKKDIPSIDGKVKGCKLEAFIFDVFQFAKTFHLLQVKRKEEFSGIKNPQGSGLADTPDTARSDIYALHRKWIEAAGGTITGDGAVEVAGLVSYDGEGLQELCSGKTFTSPVFLQN